MKKSLLVVLGAATFALLLYACGGGSGSATSTGTTTPSASMAGASSVSGTVTGFASVVIDGNEYGDSAATSVTEEIDPAAPWNLGVGGLQLGQSVDFALQGGMLGAGVVRPRVVGPVASISGTQFVALGQTVETSSTTVFGGGYTGVGSMNTGDVVKVHGWENADGSIAATRVELVATPSALPGYLVAGFAAGLGGTAPTQTFVINGLAVTDSAATIVLPNGATIANGDDVAVFAPVAAFAGTTTAAPSVAASVVRVHVPPAVGSTIVQGGLVRTVSTSGGTVTSFSLDNYTVDTTLSSLTIVDNGAAGSLSDIVAGANVVVLGTVSGTDTLLASKIWIWTPRALLAGPILSVASGNSATGGTFMLRNTSVTYNASTVFKPQGASWSELQAGAFVFVTGTMGATGLTADMIAFTPVPCGTDSASFFGQAPNGWSPPAANQKFCPMGAGAGPSVVFHYFGTASAVTSSGSSGSFTLTEANGTSITVDESSSTVFAPPGDTIASVADGSQVLVLGSLTSSGDVDATLVVVVQ